ncbi:hypothetical protein D3C86_1452180 [compost metagenome]
MPSIFTEPPEMVLFSLFTACPISMNEILAASIFLRSTLICISGSSAPTISTPAISFRPSIRSSISSAYSFNFLRSKSPEILMYMIGRSERLMSMITGSSGKSDGRSGLALSTASLIRCFASLISTPALNSAVIKEKSWKELDVTFFRPSVPLISFSNCLVTRFSMFDGEVPG